jgi:hypothetical protein
LEKWRDKNKFHFVRIKDLSGHFAMTRNEMQAHADKNPHVFLCVWPIRAFQAAQLAGQIDDVTERGNFIHFANNPHSGLRQLCSSPKTTRHVRTKII